MKTKAAASPIRAFFGSVLHARESGIAIPLILLIVIISIVNPVFLDIDNLLNIARQISFVFIIGIAMTFVLIGAGLDLSVGSVLALAGVLCGIVLRALMLSMPMWLAIGIAILVGIVLGMLTGIFNGLIITRYKIPSLIVTLGMMYIARGIVQVLTRGVPVYPFPDEFNNLGQGYLLGVPNVVYVAVVLGIIAHIALTQTSWGRAVFAVGGNMETARLSGINVVRVLTSAYVLCGIAAAVSGVLTTARLASALANAGTGMELQVIAACIIGGTSMFGGSGSILGTLIGAAFMSIIANGMVLMKISVYYQSIVIGVIIILAVGIDQFRRRRGGMLG